MAFSQYKVEEGRTYKAVFPKKGQLPPTGTLLNASLSLFSPFAIGGWKLPMHKPVFGSHCPAQLQSLWEEARRSPEGAPSAQGHRGNAPQGHCGSLLFKAAFKGFNSTSPLGPSELILSIFSSAFVFLASEEGRPSSL